MPNAIQHVEKSGAPVESAPPSGDIIDGAPAFRTWKLEDNDGLRCGLRECSPGEWSVTYEVWEYAKILEGSAILTPADEEPITLEPGDSYIFRVGLRCTWHVKQTILKEFVTHIQ